MNSTMNKLPTEDEIKSKCEGGNEDEDEDESLLSSIAKLGFPIKVGLDLALLLLPSFIRCYWQILDLSLSLSLRPRSLTHSHSLSLSTSTQDRDSEEV